MILIIMMAIVFTAVLAVGQGMYWTWVARQEQQRQELMRRLGAGGGDQSAEDIERLFLTDDGQNAGAFGQLGATLETALVRADSTMTVQQLVTRMFGLAGIGMVVGGVSMGFIGVFLGVPGFLLPYFLVLRQANKRAEALISQIPDALDLMGRSMQAGMGLTDAFKLVADEMPMPISGEFGRMFEEVRLGREYREAFQGMLDRNPGVFDLRLFVSSVLLQRETGGNLIEILENISGTIRTRFGFQAKVRAMTSEAKFTAMILAALPLFVMTVLTLMNPDYLTPLFDELIGNVILLYCACSYCMGLFIMNEMTKVEV